MMALERRRTGHVGLGAHDVPQMVNLNEDVQLSGKNRFEFALHHRYRIGGLTSSAESDDGSTVSTGSDEDEEGQLRDAEEEDEAEAVITLTGHGIYPKHAMITNMGHSCQLQSHGPSARLTWVNGVNFVDLIEQQEADEVDEQLAFGSTSSLNRRATLELPQSAEGNDSPRRLSRLERKRMEKELPFVALQHGDRIAFGCRIFVFSHPHASPQST